MSSHSPTKSTQSGSPRTENRAASVPGRGGAGGRQGPGRGRAAAPCSSRRTACSQSFHLTGKIVRKTPLRLAEDKSSFYLTLMKIAQQHVAQSMTSMTAASTPENPSSSQELEAHLQDFCGGPSKENPPSRHPARGPGSGPLDRAPPPPSRQEEAGTVLSCAEDGRGQNRVSVRQGHGSSLEHSCPEPRQ